MTDIAIQVKNLSKHYRLGAGPAGKGDFREAARSAVSGLRRRFTGGVLPPNEEAEGRDLWALRDISFEVKRGEVVGLIGHNGAGKSTLLKILSRITDPTSGHAWYDGRLGSLLEVGTGFHPELTGRENVFMSGAILGMTRREIEKNFDQIVEFSEIGRFIDTPVKRYSSGMFVRLGFSVAAHLRPEILIVDEVLAVGDAAFQKKCLEKMREVSESGRTILFVSHNMGSIQELCDRAIVLNKGRVIGEGLPMEAVKLYLQSMGGESEVPLVERLDRRGRGRTRLVGASIASRGHEDSPGLLLYGMDATVRLQVSELLPDLTCTFAIYDSRLRPVCRFSSRVIGEEDRVADTDAFTCDIPELTLVPDEYVANLVLKCGPELEDRIDAAFKFRVEPGQLGGRPLDPTLKDSVFAPRHRWTVPSGT